MEEDENNRSLLKRRSILNRVKFDDNVKYFSIGNNSDQHQHTCNHEECNSDENEKLKRVNQHANPLSLTNFIWFSLSIVVVYYSNIVNVILYDQAIHR